MSRYDLLTHRVKPIAYPIEEYTLPKEAVVEVSVSMGQFEYGRIESHYLAEIVEKSLYHELCKKIGWPIARDAVRFSQRMAENMMVIFSARIEGFENKPQDF